VDLLDSIETECQVAECREAVRADGLDDIQYLLFRIRNGVLLRTRNSGAQTGEG
jgi:hypothetical protein